MAKTVRLAAAAAVCLGSAPAQSADPLGLPIGKLISVSGDVRVSRAGQQTSQPIEQDGRVYPGDVLRTDKNAGYQLLLVDRSLLNGGADSVMAVNRYAFDPRTNAGGLIATFQRGLFRFVGPPYALASQQPIIRCALLTQSGGQERLAALDVPIQTPPNSEPIQLQCQRRVLEPNRMAELLRSIGETPGALTNRFAPPASSGAPQPQTAQAESSQPDKPAVQAPAGALFPNLPAPPDLPTAPKEPPTEDEAEDREWEKLGRPIFDLSDAMSDGLSTPLDGAPDGAAPEEPEMAAEHAVEGAETLKTDEAQADIAQADSGLADRTAKDDVPSVIIEVVEPGDEAGGAVASDGAAAAVSPAGISPVGISKGNGTANESLRTAQALLKDTRDILRRLRDRRISGAVTPMPETAPADSGPIELTLAPEQGSVSIWEIVAESPTPVESSPPVEPPPPVADKKIFDAVAAPPSAGARDRLAAATQELVEIEALIAELPSGAGDPSLRARIVRARDDLDDLRGEILELREAAIKEDDATIERLASRTPMTESQYETRLRRADEILSGPKFATLKEALEYIAFGDNPGPPHGTLAPYAAQPPSFSPPSFSPPLFSWPTSPPTSPDAPFPTGPRGGLEAIGEQDEIGMTPPGHTRYAAQSGAYPGPIAAREGREAIAVKF